MGTLCGAWRDSNWPLNMSDAREEIFQQKCMTRPGREILLSWKMYFKNGRLCYDSRVVVAAVAQCSRNMDNKKNAITRSPQFLVTSSYW